MNQRVASFKLISNGNHCSHAGHQNCHWVVIILLLDLTSKYFDHRVLQSSASWWRGGWGGSAAQEGDYWLSILLGKHQHFPLRSSTKYPEYQASQNHKFLDFISRMKVWVQSLQRHNACSVFFSSINFLLNDFILHPFMKGVLTNADNSENYWLFISVPPCRRRSSSKSQIFSLHHRPPFQGRLVSRLWIFCLFCWERKETNIVSLVMENKMSSI